MKKIIALLVFLILATMLTGSVSAISLSSSLFRPNPMLFEPGLSFSKTYTISKFKYGAAPYVNGDLSEYVDLEIIQNNSGRIVFIANINLPETLEPAGIHEIFIGAKEVAPPNGGIVALTRAQKLLKFRVLYEDKIATFRELVTPNMNENKIATFSFSAESLSKQNMTGINGQIRILDFDNKLIKTIPFKEFDLASAEKKNIKVEFDSTGLSAGQYFAFADINWENEVTVLDNTFNIGTLQIDILDYSKNFTAGQINRVTIDIESKWKGLIKTVFAEFYIDNEYQSTTQTYSVNSFETSQILGFLDLTYVEVGEHDFNIILQYDGEQSIIDEKITINGKAKEKPIRIGFSSIEIMMVLVISVLVIIIAIMFRHKKKNEN